MTLKPKRHIVVPAPMPIVASPQNYEYGTRWFVYIEARIIGYHITGYADVFPSEVSPNRDAKMVAIEKVLEKSNVPKGEHSAWAMPLKDEDMETIIVKKEISFG